MVPSAPALAQGWQTPGKRLVGLRIVGSGCAMCREVRRVGVFVIVGSIQMVVSYAPDSVLWLGRVPPMATSIVGVSLVVLFCVYYVWPLVVLRGAMWYDRATGFKVMRAE